MEIKMEGIWANMEKVIWSKDHRGSSSGSLSNPLWPQHQNSRKNIKTVFFLILLNANVLNLYPVYISMLE